MIRYISVSINKIYKTNQLNNKDNVNCFQNEGKSAKELNNFYNILNTILYINSMKY